MTDFDKNPFQELYVTDSPDPRAFVALFSSFPVQHALALFRPGHVVLKGTQGSGKSMLLNLFRPQIRLAYHNAATVFPIPKSSRQFVGAGINLTRSGALDIGNRPLSKDPLQDDALFPLYFADFINYFIVKDILQSVSTMAQNPAAFEGTVKEAALDSFAVELAKSPCWFGALDGSRNFEDVSLRIDERLSAYRAFHLFNTPSLPDIVSATKTNIGEPIAVAADTLRACAVVEPDTPVFVRLDQVERLYRSDVLRPDVGVQYRRMLNKALGLRDSRVWYRVGTRQHAWEDDLRFFGSADMLENLRDYRIIDLDDMLRRKEDIKTWIFPDFAEDAFSRRLRHAAYAGSISADLVGRVFGPTEDPKTTAALYCSNSAPERILRLSDFGRDWSEFLTRLYQNDPLEAVMASAWARQRGTEGRAGVRMIEPPPSGAPWNRQYWRKERLRQALLQIAARASQRLKWSGEDHVLALSAGNISIFLSLCHEVWDAFLRAERRRPPEARRHPVVDGLHPDVQAVGIQTASAYWYEKLPEQPSGDDRRRFLDVIAVEFRSWLLSDLPMSNPGRNGFSLAVKELHEHPSLERFLGDLADYGDLVQVSHTTKERNRQQRRKWYLNPILSPYYQVPESHTKEPYYATVAEVAEWLNKAKINVPGFELPASPDIKERSAPRSTPLFDRSNGEGD